MAFLKPSPERLGLRGTKAWRETTVRSFIRLALAGTILAFAPNAIAYASNQVATQGGDRVVEGCFTPASLRKEMARFGAAGVKTQILIKGRDVCAGIPASAFAEDQQEFVELAAGSTAGQESAS